MARRTTIRLQESIFRRTLLTVLCLSAVAAFSQDQEIKFSALASETAKASSITWRQHFGYRKEEPHNTYILMTQGGFRAPTSTNLESLIRSWLREHPNADLILVYTIEPMMTTIPDSKMKSVWVVDGEDNLNIHLVRMGGCPAGTMLLNGGDKTPVTREDYEAFSKKVIEAEGLAKKEKLGIWSEQQK
jgi:hypothetical protein